MADKNKTDAPAAATPKAEKKLSKQLKGMVAVVKLKHKAATASMADTLRAHKETGEALLDLKKAHGLEYPHPGKGEGWGEWCETHCDISRQYAHRLMTIATEEGWAKVEKAEKEAKYGLTLLEAYRIVKPVEANTTPKLKPRQVLKKDITDAIETANLFDAVKVVDVIAVLKAMGFEVLTKAPTA